MPGSASKPPVEEAQRIQLLCIVHPFMQEKTGDHIPHETPITSSFSKNHHLEKKVGEGRLVKQPSFSHQSSPAREGEKKGHFHERRGVCGIKAPAAGEGGGGRPPPSTFLGRRHSLVAAHQAPAPSPLPERGGFLPAAVPLPGAAYLAEDETGGSCAAIGSLQSAPPGGRASASLEAGGSNSGDGAERSGRQRQ